MPVIPKGYIITDKCCDKTRFYDSIDDFPETGLVSRLYVDRSTGIIYVWDGTEYITADTPVIIVEDYTALRALTNYPHDVVAVADFTYEGPDGNDYTTLGGIFKRVAAGTENGGTIIVATNGDIWERDWDGYVRPEFFESGTDVERINNALDVGNTIVGDTIEDLYEIDSPILPKDNQTLIINGTIKAKSQTSELLLNNLVDGATSITVNDGSIYKVGQYIAVSDNVAAIQGGSTQTRRVAGVVKILSVVGNVLNTTELQGTYTVANGGYLAITTNIVLVENKTNVTIKGSGVLDGDWVNQVDFEGITPSGASFFEETRSQCGITIINSNHCTIDGLTIKNNPLHNITGWNSSHLKISNVELLNAHDKNILCFGDSSTDWFVNNIIINGSEFEDGLAFYTGPSYSFISNVHVLNCPRYGIINEAGSLNNNYSGLVIENCGTGVAILGSNNSFNGVKIVNSASTSLILQDETGITPLNYIKVQNLSIKGTVLSGNPIIINSIKNSSITDFNIDGITNSSTYAININTNSDNINISNGVIKDCYRGLSTSTSTNISLINVALINPILTTTEDISMVRMINCAGWRDPIMFNQDIYTNGRIGIGTKDPAVSLHIQNGNMYIIGGTNPRFLVGDDLSTQYGGFQFNSSANSVEILNGVTPIITAKASGDTQLRGYVEFIAVHANHGATVLNGSIWLATDGLFYKKNAAGVVTLL